jgi:hypothetical protein
MRRIPDRLVTTQSERRVNFWSVFLVPLIPVVLLGLSVWSDLRSFNENAPFVEAQGKVARLDCHNHGQYEVSFSVGERVLTRGAGNLYLRGNCNDFRIGEAVTVWYSVQDPNFASFVTPDHPVSYMKSEIAQLLIVAYPVFVAVVFLAMKFAPHKREAA